MAIAPVGGASGHNGNDTFATVAYTPTSTSNTLVFTLAIDNDAAATLSVDDNGGGHSATQSAIVSNGVQRVAIFTMTPPSTGALTFKGLSSVASQDVVITVEEYSGVSSIGNTGTKTGSTSPMNVDVVMQDTNNYVVGGFASRGTAAPTTGNPGTFRQGAFDNAVDREASGLADRTSASTGSLNVGLTIPGGDFTWAAVGIELRGPVTVIAPAPLWPYNLQTQQVPASKLFARNARVQQTLWFTPQDTTFTPPPSGDSYAQFNGGVTSLRASNLQYAKRALFTHVLLWADAQDQGLAGPIPDTYTPPVNQTPYWDSVERNKNRAIFSQFLTWNGGGDTVLLPAQHTYTQLPQVSPLFDQRQRLSNLRAVKGTLFHLDTSAAPPPPIQPDTYVPDIQGLSSLRQGQSAYSARLQFALDLTWNFPGDVSLLPPQPDTYIQPVQGVGGILAANKAFGGNARTLSTLSWNWAKDQSFTVVQQHTYIQDIQGLLSNERDRLARFRTAVKANTRMWETYPFLSIPPPPPIPQLLVLTATVNSFLLTWQNDPTALVYNVYRGLRSGQEALYGISLTPNFVDANVVRGITYFYRVTSVVILESDFSNEVFGMLLASTSAEVPLTGVDRERRHQEWYVCDRCGTYYPRERMLNQNGLNLCTGADTHNCWDKRGHAVNERFLDIPYEQRPEPLPWQDDEL